MTVTTKSLRGEAFTLLEPDRPDGCPMRDVLDRLGDKWSVLIILTLLERPRRFGELRRAIPDISQRVLTLALRNLQRDGLLYRKVVSASPPAVEYGLTALGKTLHDPIDALLTWANRHHQTIREQRALFDLSQKGAASERDPNPTVLR
jgi:DNA-binding HxlR family transcriptional regulator